MVTELLLCLLIGIQPLHNAPVDHGIHVAFSSVNPRLLKLVTSSEVIKQSHICMEIDKCNIILII